MYTYPKSAVHQAAIDAAKPERDQEDARSRAAKNKLSRELDAAAALRKVEEKRLAELAKTARLRAARLALEAEEKAQQPSGKGVNPK